MESDVIEDETRELTTSGKVYITVLLKEPILCLILCFLFLFFFSAIEINYVITLLARAFTLDLTGVYLFLGLYFLFLNNEVSLKKIKHKLKSCYGYFSKLSLK